MELSGAGQRHRVVLEVLNGIPVTEVAERLGVARQVVARSARPRPDTGSMRDKWVHVGRLWTNGERFLAVDAALRGAWQGGSDMEVFETEADLVAIVQASDSDYPEVLTRALGYPVADDLDGDTLKVPSGEIAIFSAGLDGTGPGSEPFASARPGPVPPVYRPLAYRDPQPPGLLMPAQHAEYKLKVRWYTMLDEDNCFARWLLIPIHAND